MRTITPTDGSSRASVKQRDISVTVSGVNALRFSGLLMVICSVWNANMETQRINRSANTHRQLRAVGNDAMLLAGCRGSHGHPGDAFPGRLVILDLSELFPGYRICLPPMSRLLRHLAVYALVGRLCAACSGCVGTGGLKPHRNLFSL